MKTEDYIRSMMNNLVEEYGFFGGGLIVLVILATFVVAVGFVCVIAVWLVLENPIFLVIPAGFLLWIIYKVIKAIIWSHKETMKNVR